MSTIHHYAMNDYGHCRQQQFVTWQLLYTVQLFSVFEIQHFLQAQTVCSPSETRNWCM